MAWQRPGHDGFALTASPRRSRLDGVRLVAVEARWLRLHINTMAITPRQRRLDGCGLAIRCRCTRPDHVDNHGAAQANDEQHQDHRHREWRLRPLRGLEDIMHLSVSLPVSSLMRPLPVLPVSSPQTAADHSPTCVAIRQ